MLKKGIGICFSCQNKKSDKLPENALAAIIAVKKGKYIPQRESLRVFCQKNKGALPAVALGNKKIAIDFTY